MTNSIEKLMELGKAYGWHASDYEDRRTTENLDAMEMAEQEFRSALQSALPNKAAAYVDDPDHLRSQLVVMSHLLGQAIEIVKNVEAESSDEGNLLRTLINESEAARIAVARQQMALWKGEAREATHG